MNAEDTRMKVLGVARTWALLGLDCDAGVAMQPKVEALVDNLIAERDAARKIAQELAAALEDCATVTHARGAAKHIGYNRADCTSPLCESATKVLARYAADAAAQEGRDG